MQCGVGKMRSRGRTVSMQESRGQRMLALDGEGQLFSYACYGSTPEDGQLPFHLFSIIINHFVAKLSTSSNST